MSQSRYLLGLTGSIGMGKTTTSRLFTEAGVPVWDADAVVERLYAKGGKGVVAISELVPSSVHEGAVDRSKLKTALASDDKLLARIEAVIHPLVEQKRIDFISESERSGGSLAVFDIPLLFETGAEKWLDGVAVVTCPPAMQRQRVLARPGMDGKTFALILARQMPDAEKRARADFIIDTSRGIEDARAQVQAVIRDIHQGKTRA